MLPKVTQALKDWARGAIQKTQFRLRQRGAKPISAAAFRRPGAPSIVMIPGVWEEWGVLTRWGSALYNAGYDVRYVPHMDRVLGPIDDLARDLLDWMEHERIDKTVIVAHSKGGLVGKRAMIIASDRFVGLVACGTPFRGAPLARLLPPASKMRDLTPENTDVTSLADDLPSNHKTVLIEATWDQNVPRIGVLPGAVHLTAPIKGHNALLGDKETAKLIAETVNHIYRKWQ